MLIFIVVLLTFTHGPKSITAEINLQDALPPLAHPLEHSKDTQKYIEARDLHDDSLDSYLFAYNNGKEIPTEVTKPKIIKRIKRNPIELIKFELADAKEPDEMTKALLQEIRKQRMLEHETLKIKPKNDTPKTSKTPLTRRSSDLIPADSKKVRIFAPNGMEVKSMENVPIGVRKAIERMVLHKRSLYNGQPAKRYAAGLENSKLLYQGYGELPYKLENSYYNKGVNLDFANQIPYIPALFPGHHSSASQEHKTMLEARPVQNQAFPNEQNFKFEENIPQLKFVHFAKPIFAPSQPKLEQPALKQEEHFQDHTLQQDQQSQHQPHNSVNINLPLGGKKIEINFDDEYVKHSIQEVTHLPVTQQKLRVPSNTDEMTKVLKDLISKTPTEQLQGLSLLLARKQNSFSGQSEPEKSKSAILFPPTVNRKTPNPEENHVQEVHVTARPREFTPITEQILDDVTPAPNIQYIPVRAHFEAHPVVPTEQPELPPPQPYPYKEVNMDDLSPNYEKLEHYDDGNEFQYASKYNFGYRIRDFHTGNDFGHTEKRDNDGVTRGQYHILLPDGRIQNVEYHVDDSGYHADVTYESVH